MGSRKVRGPSETELDHPLNLQQYSKIANALRDVFPTLKVSEPSLSRLVAHFQAQLEATLGREATTAAAAATTTTTTTAAPNEGLVKLPARLFREFSVGGSLFVIVKLCLELCAKHQWPDLDLSRLTDKAELLAFFRNVETALLQGKHFEYPRVYFVKDKVPNVAELAQIVHRHKGFVVEHIENATHVVEWNAEVDNAPAPIASEEVTDDYVRVISYRPDEEKGHALVHWWYYPDSYDEWIGSDEVDVSDISNSVSFEKQNKQWRVGCRFIKDCGVFNEWGNEIDYEVDHEGEVDGNSNSALAANEIQQKRNSKLSKSKQKVGANNKAKKDAPIVEAIESTEKSITSVLPPSMDSSRSVVKYIDISVDGGIQSRVEHVGSSSNSTNNSSNSENSGSGSGSVSTGAAAGGEASKKRKLQDAETPTTETKKSKSSASGKLTSDKFPEWFSIETVSGIELRYLADCIESSRMSPAEYLSVRNFIINLYSQNPTVYLSGTDCRRKLGGDVCIILKIHEFLDAFGLINQSVKFENRPPIPAYAIKVDSSIAVPNMQGPDLKSSSSSLANSFRWTPELDQKLLEAVQKHNGNWLQVEASMREAVESITKEQCLARFVEIPLVNPLEVGSADKMDVDQSAPPASVSASTRNDSESLEFLLKNYMTLRLEAFEEKMKLISQLEGILDSEREHLDIERRDVMIQRAQLALIQNKF